MMMKLYCIKDQLVEFGTNVMVATKDEVIIRGIKNLVNEKGTEFNLNASDLSLYCIGEYDTKLGSIKPELELICHLDSLKEVKENGNN